MPAPAAPSPPAAIELSVVIPCLDEAETLEICITKAQRAMREAGIGGEVIVADNGSTDGSREIAERLGARVVAVAEKGYGSALQGGIEAARGAFVIMGDADDSYDFLAIPQFVDKLREGYDLVQGCRLPAGGGTVATGAMPFLHRWLGNPLFSWMARKMFQAPIHDIYCGYRGFKRSLYDDLDLRATGMEFATEMIIKASLYGRSFAETPITLHPDGRVAGRPHLRTFQDGWRTLRFFLMYSPRWLFFAPGLALVLLGLLGFALALPAATLFGATFDAHTLVFSNLMVLLGYQGILFSIFAKTFAISEGLHPPDPKLERLLRLASLERGLIAGGAAMLAGLGLLASVVVHWMAADFGSLDYASEMRAAVPGAMLTALGFETLLASFLISILRMRRR